MPNDAHQLRPSGPFISDMPGDSFSSLQEIESKADHLRNFLRNWHTWDPVLGIWRDLDKPEFRRKWWDLRDAVTGLPFRWFKVDPLIYDDWNIVGENSEVRCLFYSKEHCGVLEFVLVSDDLYRILGTRIPGWDCDVWGPNPVCESEDAAQRLDGIAYAAGQLIRKLRVKAKIPESRDPMIMHTADQATDGALSGANGDIDAADKPSATLNDIPPLDKTNCEWVLAKAAATAAGVVTSTLSNDRITPLALRSKDMCAGIDRRRRMWRKERKNSQHTWYYLPSLSYKTSQAL